MRRTLPIVLLGAAATVVLRKRLLPRPALPPGEPSVAGVSTASGADVAAATSAAIAEQSAAVLATADASIQQSGSAAATPEQQPAEPVLAATATVPARAESRFTRRLRRAPVDIVTVVDDLLSAAR